MADTDFLNPQHPHEPEIAPVLDPEGRCLVCGCQWRDEQIERLDVALTDALDLLDQVAEWVGSVEEPQMPNRTARGIAQLLGRLRPVGDVAPCLALWHETRTVKRAHFCPVCGEQNHDPSRPNG